jgi:flagellar motility protein MotE (MotC chaperone)
MTPTPAFSRSSTTRSRGGPNWLGALIAAALFACPASAQDGRTPEGQKSKGSADKGAEIEASRYCANVAPSVTEARIAWQTKRLNEIDAEVKQRLAELEKAEASVQEWVAKREALLKAASDDVVAIYAKMQPESAAQQISGMDDQTATAILAKLKPSAAGAILNEMEAERASKLAALLSGASEGAKKS